MTAPNDPRLVRTDEYRRKLRDRYRAERVIADFMSHVRVGEGEQSVLDGMFIWREKLEAELRRYHAYAFDAEGVWRSGQQRLHDPNETPVDDLPGPPCRLCLRRKARSGIAANFVRGVA